MSMLVENTLPKLLKRNYQRYGSKKVAMRVKDRGIWQRYTWEQCYQKVKYLSLGLISLGLEVGDKVAILGETKPESYWAEFAAQAARGTAIGIFADCTPPEVEYFVTHSECKFVFAHDQEQVDKLLPISNKLPLVEKVIYWDAKGLWFYTDPLLMSFDQVLDLGRKYEALHPGHFEQTIEDSRSDDIAVFLYTSGTTGLPKAAMISHQSIITWGNEMKQLHPIDDSDEFMSFLSLAWIGEQSFGISNMLLSGMTTNFPEKPETVQENIREIGPSILFYSPKLWENINRTIQAKMIDAHPLKRFFYYLFLPVNYKIADIRLANEKLNFVWKVLHLVGYTMVVRPLLDKLGLLGKKVVYTGGIAISPDIMHFFYALGLNIVNVYGISETGLIATHWMNGFKSETCGPPSPQVQLRISEEGEILVRSQGLFAGYYKNAEATQQSMKGGWYHTGDFGNIDEAGHLIVMDRMADVKELAGGNKFSPQYAETRLRFSPYIKDILVVGGGDKTYVSAIVNIDIENVGRWAEIRHLAYTTIADLSQKQEVTQLIRKDMDRLNKNLPEWARIKKFVNLHKDFDADEAELTRTRKLRRSFVEERYSDIIVALYSNDTEIMVETPIVYRDGRRGVMKRSIQIAPVD
jgi:long-chain acyl-CoA synthetase